MAATTRRPARMLSMVPPRDRSSTARTARAAGTIAEASALDLDVSVLDDLRPLRRFGADEGGELLARTAAVFGAVGVELLLHVGHGEDLVDVLVHLLRDRRGQLAGADQAIPGGGLEAGEALLLHRRHARVAL